MSKSKILKEAIADAKMLKQTALQNAKLALSETFSPKINSLISETLTEQEELEETYSLEEDLDNLQESEEELQEGDETISEEYSEGETSDDSLEDLDSVDGDGMDELEMSEELGDEEVGEITVDELKDVLRDVMAELEGTSEEELDNFSSEEEFETEEELGMVAESETEDLNELSSGGEDFGSSLSTDNNALFQAVKKAIKKSPEFLKKLGTLNQDLAQGFGKAMRNESEELMEAKKAINVLKKTLNEVNLLNAKLLYSNKIFNSFNLTESQRIKVMKSFDNTENTKEAKKVFSTLKESLSMITKPKRLNENMSFASKSIKGNSVKRPLNESKQAENTTVNRWQVLAGIKKS